MLKADTLILEKALDCNGVCQPNQRKGHNKSVPNPWRPLEQLFLHAEGGLVRWKEAYVCPGATLPPGWLERTSVGREGRRLGKWNIKLAQEEEEEARRSQRRRGGEGEKGGQGG